MEILHIFEYINTDKNNLHVNKHGSTTLTAFETHMIIGAAVSILQLGFGDRKHQDQQGYLSKHLCIC